MIAGRVQAPYVYLDNDRIGRRHAHSVALSLFLRHALETTGTVWRRAGEFFAGRRPGRCRTIRRVPQGLPRAGV